MRWIIVALVLACARAHAGTVGVIVTGETAVQARLTADAARFLEAHGHAVAVGALEPGAISNLLDCLSLDDTKCARDVVEKRARAESILAVRSEVAKGAPREITLVVYWLVKGHSPISMRRVCEKCSDAALDATFEAMLAELLRSGTEPPGTDHPELVTVRPPPPRGEEHHAHRTLPALVLGVGIAGVLTGGVLYATSESATGAHPTYRDTKNLGLGIAIGGAVLAGVGVVLLLRGGGDGPTINATAGGVTAGWIGRF